LNRADTWIITGKNLRIWSLFGWGNKQKTP
jgi:hypothetical protein